MAIYIIARVFANSLASSQGAFYFMAYMFGNVDEDEQAVPVDANVTTESTQLRQGAVAVFVGSACLLAWLPPVAVFGMIASGALILAT